MEKQVRRSLDADRVAYLLVDSYWRVSVLDEIDSTQNILKSNQPTHGDVVTAEFQSQGRGRLDRNFDATKSSGLLFSLFIAPKRKRDEWGFVSLIAGIAVVKSLGSQIYKAKWPNDVLSSDGKVCGILCEIFQNGIIVGIGINVSTERNELPVDNASSVYLTEGKIADREELLIMVLRNFQELFQMWDLGVDLLDEYAAISLTLGKDVRIELPTGLDLTGNVSGFTTKGELLLDENQLVSVGDIYHLR